MATNELNSHLTNQLDVTSDYSKYSDVEQAPSNSSNSNDDEYI
jgi:hypothetical protein